MTSTYTKQALDFAQSVGRIMLIDGQMLTALKPTRVTPKLGQLP